MGSSTPSTPTSAGVDPTLAETSRMTFAAQTAPNLSFYEATAQIIPVLFLALVVEERIFGRREEPAPALELIISPRSSSAASGSWSR